MRQQAMAAKKAAKKATKKAVKKSAQGHGGSQIAAVEWSFMDVRNLYRDVRDTSCIASLETGGLMWIVGSPFCIAADVFWPCAGL